MSKFRVGVGDFSHFSLSQMKSNRSVCESLICFLLREQLEMMKLNRRSVTWATAFVHQHVARVCLKINAHRLFSLASSFHPELLFERWASSRAVHVVRGSLFYESKAPPTIAALPFGESQRAREWDNRPDVPMTIMPATRFGCWIVWVCFDCPARCRSRGVSRPEGSAVGERREI